MVASFMCLEIATKGFHMKLFEDDSTRYELREYQRQAIDDLTGWLRRYDQGNPILWLPTGSGKSLIAAEIARIADSQGKAVLMTVPSKELCEQNYEKAKAYLDDLGIVSAAVGKKEFNHQCTIATIGSIYKNSDKLKTPPSIILIDECQLVNRIDLGMYRQLIAAHPDARVVGLTATPFDGRGVWLYEGVESIWTGIASQVGIIELTTQGYLSPLTTKGSQSIKINTKGVKKTAGDFNIKSLAKATDVENINKAIVLDVLSKGKDRKAWMMFCVTIEHAAHMVQAFKDAGLYSVALVTGDTPKKERESIIEMFRCGEIRCLVSVAALTTGFDVPAVDLIVWLRNTVSPILYCQGLGRGMRIAEGKENCLVLDYTDTTRRLGCVDTIQGKLENESGGEAPVKQCPECDVFCHASLKVCPNCGFEFEIEEELKYSDKATKAPVLSLDTMKEWRVTSVKYFKHKKKGKPDSLRVEYFNKLQPVATEWVCLNHEGFAGVKSKEWLEAHTTLRPLPSLDEIVTSGGKMLDTPSMIQTVVKNGYKHVV